MKVADYFIEQVHYFDEQLPIVHSRNFKSSIESIKQQLAPQDAVNPGIKILFLCLPILNY